MDPFAQFHRPLFARDLDKASRNYLTHLALSDIFVEARWDQLLHAQPELPLLLVNVKYLRLHHLAGTKHILRSFNPLLRADLADVNHALNPFAKLHKRATLREA